MNFKILEASKIPFQLNVLLNKILSIHFNYNLLVLNNYNIKKIEYSLASPRIKILNTTFGLFVDISFSFSVKLFFLKMRTHTCIDTLNPLQPQYKQSTFDFELGTHS